MRAWLSLFFLLSASASYAQSIALKEFVKKDTVLLRWAPSDFSLLLSGLKNGYEIQRIQDSETFVGNNSLTSFHVPAFKERESSYLFSTDQNTRELAGFFSNLLESNPDEAGKKIVFAQIVLGAGNFHVLAEMAGLYYADYQLPQGDCSYRVRINGESVFSNTIHVKTSLLSQNAPMTELECRATPRSKQAYLKWDAASLNSHYAGYWIQRSTDSIHFDNRNLAPVIFFTSQDEKNKTHCDFVDTGVVEGSTYFYRICGINHFAEKGNVSNVVKVYIPKSIHCEVRIENVVAEKTFRIVTGKLISSSSQKNEITNLILMRSDSLFEGYTLVEHKPFTTDTFSFRCNVETESGDRYYYKVGAIGVDNDTVFSYAKYFFTLDQIPPASPQGLLGTINDSGVVYLNWSTNLENDLRGYRVYRANSLNEEFVEVTTRFCTNTLFTDTLALNNLTPEVYYSVSAVDLNYNNSALSPPLKLMKPDTIAPVGIVFKNYTVSKNGVSLFWNNSPSKDVYTNKLIRTNGQKTDTIYTWKDTSSVFFDSTGTAGTTYEYVGVTVDHSQNITRSQKLRVNYETGIRPGVSALSGKANREQKTIELTWILPPGEIYAVQIYRAKNDGVFTLYQTLRSPSPSGYTDKNLAINNTYRYQVKVIYKTGASSILSEELRITY